MLKEIGKGLLGRLLSYGALCLGFWLLYQGFLRPNVGLGMLGGGLVLVAMYLMARVRRSTLTSLRPGPEPREEEEDPGDTLTGSNQSN